MSIAKCEQHGAQVVVVWDDTPIRETKRSRRCPMCELEDKLESAQFEVDLLKDELEAFRK